MTRGSKFLWLETAICAVPSAGVGHELKYPKTEYGQRIDYALDTDSEKNGLNSIKQRCEHVQCVFLCTSLTGVYCSVQEGMLNQIRHALSFWIISFKYG